MKIVLILFLLIPSSLLLAEPKTKILVQPTLDRWIHFPDGVKLRHGFEITHMLNQFLFDQGTYRVKIPASGNVGIERSLAAIDVENPDSIDDLLRERLPNSKLDYYKDKFSNIEYGIGDAHIIVQPRVHTLLYASGKKSNRVVYGFSPDRINKYNIGVDGGAENDFIATKFDATEQCTELDFFGGQLNATGYASKRSNFGADADEGFSFEIFGFGISVKKKEFEVKLGVSFDVIVPGYSYARTFDYEFKAKGKDRSISASYAGISIGYETQRRFTMREAIDQGIPLLMEEFLRDLPSRIWSAKLVKLSDGQWYLDAGLADGIEAGMLFESERGNQYVVTMAHPTVGQVLYALDNPSLPFEGEELRYVAEEGVSPWRREIGIPSIQAVGFNKLSKNNPQQDLSPVHRKIAGELQNLSSEEVVEQNVGRCTRKKMSWWERLLVSFASGYAKWRFENVYDQSFEEVAKKDKSQVGSQPTVALLSSGVYPYEKSLANRLDATGFDFISWDSRPSDDLGPGTAAAMLLTQKTNNDFKILPVKVIGAHGETHSAAVYGAMEWLAKRQDIKMVIIPWAPSFRSNAYEEGVALLKKSGKEVIVPEGIQVEGVVQAASAKSGYKTKGLYKAKIQLAAQGVGVILRAAEKINQWDNK